MFDHLDNEVEWAGSIYQTILRKENSGGAMSIVDSTSQPNVGPPRHVHDAEDEAFVVLTGEVEFWLNGESFRRGPGETAFIPRGVEHTFRVVSDTPSRHLVILTPGGFEGFFYAMAKGGYQVPNDMLQINQEASRFNLRFTGPPLGPD